LKGVIKMLNTYKLHPKYITDEKGEKISVILSIDEYQELLEDMEDLIKFVERKNDETISHESVIKDLKNSGLL